MAESALAKRVQEMLNEEKWTRAALSNYGISNVKELDELFHRSLSEGAIDEVKAVCDEHLVHTKNSIIALYLSGLINLARQQIDDSAMVALVSIFADNKKWSVVEFVCQRILEYGENKTALQYLADGYRNEDRVDEMYAVWERLVRIDYEEAELVKLIAEKKEKDGQIDQAVDSYKKALHRFINRGQYANVKEIWNKLVQYRPDDIEFFLHVQRKIAKQNNEEKAAALLMELYRHYSSAKDWKTALDILKVVVGYGEHDHNLRKELVECYRGLYSSHSHLEDCIRLANLHQSYRSLPEAIADFEKHIAFDTGNFVYHRTWNIGRIASIDGDDIVIDFAKKRGHRMSLKMGIDSLVSLSKEHIWVLKAIWSKQKLHDSVKGDIAWALRSIIRSFDNKADLKRIKAELVPSVLTPSEWTGWSSQARETLKTDPQFGNTPDSIDTFIVRERPLSYEEKAYNQFKAEKNFFERVKYLRDFTERGDTDSEYFNEMLSFFSGYLRSYSAVNEYVVSSYLLLKEVTVKLPFLKGLVNLQFSELYGAIEDVVAVYQSMKDAEIRRALLQDIRNCVAEWPDIFIRIFPVSLGQNLVETLVANGHTDKLRGMVLSVVENYRDRRGTFIWIVKNLLDEPWVKELDISYEKIVFNLIHILDITFKEIANHRDTTENRKINKQVQTILFKDDMLERYLLEMPQSTVERVFSLVSDVKDLDSAIKMRLRKKIADKYPDMKFSGEEEKVFVSRGLLVTSDKYSEKQKLLQHIMEVDVPANQNEIAYALSLGDLRENAEYKAAKEKQDELNAKVAKLKNEIERAQIFDKSTVSTSKVFFGTTVTLLDEINNRTETYTLLGPWESDPARNVISYLSPLGKKLLNHKVGDRLSFVIHERHFQYLVQAIEAAKF